MLKSLPFLLVEAKGKMLRALDSRGRSWSYPFPAYSSAAFFLRPESRKPGVLRLKTEAWLLLAAWSCCCCWVSPRSRAKRGEKQRFLTQEGII